MFTETEGKIALLEDRLEKAWRGLMVCSNRSVGSTDRVYIARLALAAIWPTPPKPRVIEVGGVYTAKNGMIWHCVGAEGDRALMTLRAPDGGLSTAYVWSLDGKSTLSAEYNIDWSRS